VKIETSTLKKIIVMTNFTLIKSEGMLAIFFVLTKIFSSIEKTLSSK
jgi:hypothetical protein